MSTNDRVIKAPGKARPERGFRRKAIAQAALDILGESGSRALTHRAIDQHLEFPDGTTSAYYRRREDLIGAAVRELFNRDFERFDMQMGEAVGAETPLTLDEVVSFFLRMVEDVRWRSSEASRLARYECFLLARRDKEANRLLQDLFAAREQLDQRLFQMLGAPDPKDAAMRLGYTLRGIFLTLAFLPEPIDRVDIVDEAFFRSAIIAAMEGRGIPADAGVEDFRKGVSA